MQITFAVEKIVLVLFKEPVSLPFIYKNPGYEGLNRSFLKDSGTKKIIEIISEFTRLNPCKSIQFIHVGLQYGKNSAGILFT